MGAKPFAVDTRPVEGHPLFLKDLGHDDLAIVEDTDLDRSARSEDKALHVGRAAPHAPHDARARLDGVVSHVFPIN
jgi:hypothetical protein